VIYSLDFNVNWDVLSLAQWVFVWKSKRAFLVMGNVPDLRWSFAQAPSRDAALLKHLVVTRSD
jgi:hypothetical protein